jgi:8-oxo-dGTP diphosphatase
MIDASNGWYFVPATIKAVVVATDGRVLLAQNQRDEWELPGGWPTLEDDELADVVRRELREEAGIDVEVGALLHAELAVVGGHQVVIVAHRCSCPHPDGALRSEEHVSLRWFAADELRDVDLIAPYRTAIDRALG